MQYFYGFGHQATVTSLKIEAGFIGLHGEVTPYTLPLAGLLVGLNLMASHVSQLRHITITIYIIALLDTEYARSTTNDEIKVGLHSKPSPCPVVVFSYWIRQGTLAL